MQSLTGSKTSPRKREEHLSKNGKWRSFPKVPHLLQYVISGSYFGKVKINGKKIRQSLQTDVWSTAQLRLNDFLKRRRENRNKVDALKFSDSDHTSSRIAEFCSDLSASGRSNIECFTLWRQNPILSKISPAPT